MLKIIVFFIRLSFRFFSLFGIKNRVAFLSRQSTALSFDFEAIISEIKNKHQEIDIVVCLTNYAQDGFFKYAFKMLKQINIAARSKVIVVNGYVQAVCVPKDMGKRVVIQVWHALGAIKKFGLSSLGGKAGRTKEQAEIGRMHKNYDYIIAGGPGAKHAFCESFGYEEKIIKPLGLPRQDYMKELANKESGAYKAAQDATGSALLISGEPIDETKFDEHINLLYAPTMRQDAPNDDWLKKNILALAKKCRKYNANLLVSGHPLTEFGGLEKNIDEPNDGTSDDPNDGNSNELNIITCPKATSAELMTRADLIITDYSAIAFEAGFYGLPVFFYVPDIENYRISPGLFIDPLQFRDIAFTDAGELIDEVFTKFGTLSASKTDLTDSEKSSFDDFCEEYFTGVKPGAAKRVSEFILSYL